MPVDACEISPCDMPCQGLCFRAPGSGLGKGRCESLSHHVPRVLIKGPGLRKAFESLQDLWILFESHLVACGQAKHRDERLFFDRPLDPLDVGGKVAFRIADILLVQVATKQRENAIVYLKILGDLRLRAQKVRGESPHAPLIRKENVAAKQKLLKGVGLGLGDNHVGRNPVAPEYLAAAVG